MLRALCLFAALAVLGLARPPAVDEVSPPQLQASGALADRAPRPAPEVHDFLAVRAQIRRQAWLREQAIERLHADFRLHAVGTQLYTAWNTPITLKAINWYGFEYAPFVPGGLNRASLDSILSTVHHLGFNALRILFANATVELNPVVTQGLDANPQLKGLHSLDIMGRIIGRAHHFGLRVILCNTRSEPGMGPELISGLWYTNQYPESSWYNDWMTVVTRFRNRTAFVGADLRNEPHIIGNSFDLNAYFQHGPLWGSFHGTYYHNRDWHYAAETLGNKLLDIDPHLLIIVEGIQMYYDPFKNELTGALWGGNLIGVQYDPVVLSHPGQLVYSVHEYGPKMWLGDWFNRQTTYDSLATRWTHLWAYLLTAPRFMQAPIFVGEFGTCNDWHSCISDPHKPWSQGFWFTSFVRFMQSHPQVGWAYWSLNPEGPFRPADNNFYSLMTHDWQHYHPRVIQGLGPLLAEPNG